MSEKSDKFHRNASRRVDTIVEAFRVFAHCSGPGYEWTPEEVNAYLAKVETARDEVVARFTETKQLGPRLCPGSRGVRGR